MHWFADLIAAIGVVLNGIPQGIMALSLGFAVFPALYPVKVTHEKIKI